MKPKKKKKMPENYTAHRYSGETLLQSYTGPSGPCSAIADMVNQSPPYVEQEVYLKDASGNWCQVVGPRPTNPPS
jgi:hypothetical protein